jgi:hypothetical protein
LQGDEISHGTLYLLMLKTLALLDKLHGYDIAGVTAGNRRALELS